MVAPNLGNLSDKIAITVNIEPVPAARDKFGTVTAVVVNNTFGVAQTDGRTLRFSATADVTADSDLTADEKTDINKLLGDLGNGKQVLVAAQLTADGGSFTVTMDAVRALDEDWHGFIQAGFNTDASLQLMAAWAETTDANENGRKVLWVSHSAAAVAAGGPAGGSANISEDVDTNAYENTHVTWTLNTSNYANGIGAAATAGAFYKHNFQLTAPTTSFMPLSTPRDTFTTAQQVFVELYTGTSLVGEAHGALGGSRGQIWPGFVGQGSAVETIVGADFVWTEITLDLAVAVTNAAARGNRAFPFNERGNRAWGSVVNGSIRRSQRIGWVGPNIQPDAAGAGGQISEALPTLFSDLSTADVAALRFTGNITIFTNPAAREFNLTMYVQQAA